MATECVKAHSSTTKENQLKALLLAGRCPPLCVAGQMLLFFGGETHSSVSTQVQTTY